MMTKSDLERTFKQVTKFSSKYDTIIIQHALPLPLTMQATVVLTDASPCTITATIPGGITHEFTVSVTVSDFARLLRAMPNNTDILDMRVVSTESFEIRQGNRVYTVSCKMEEKIKHPLIMGRYTLDFESTQKTIQEVLPAVGHDHGRPVLSYISCTGDKMVAVDGYRLHMSEHEAPEDFSLLLPYEVATIIADMPPPITTDLVIKTDPPCSITAGNLTFVFDKPLGTYPDFSQIIPPQGTTHPHAFFIDTKDLTNELKLVMKVNSTLVNFSLDEQLSIEANDGQELSTATSLPIETATRQPDTLLVSYNPRHVLDALKAASSQDVCIEIDSLNKLFITPSHWFYPLAIIMNIHRSK